MNAQRNVPGIAHHHDLASPRISRGIRRIRPGGKELVPGMKNKITL